MRWQKRKSQSYLACTHALVAHFKVKNNKIILKLRRISFALLGLSETQGQLAGGAGGVGDLDLERKTDCKQSKNRQANSKQEL